MKSTEKLNNNTKKMLFTGLTVLAMMPAGIGIANAASGSQNAGGGFWSWSNVPGVQCTSSYYHGSRTHGASAQVGSGAVKTASARSGGTAKASAWGVGTTRVWWN